ncbi:myofilin isoform X4 [Cotesia typhae]|uniref:myofilin isoform X4 n=1 Tax=Cotesia typhae TaxID=2053667 RepID=UPI003D690E96
MDARFKSNLAMIGRNEPITRKARFWQSYVRALKGTDDMRAPEHTRKPRSIFSDYPELHSSSWPYGKSIFDNPSHASDRINVPGYRYLPVHREIYGYSPRQLYPHQYKPVERFVSDEYPGQWQKWLHLRRLNELSDLRIQQIRRKWQNRENILHEYLLKLKVLRNRRYDMPFCVCSFSWRS